jgi:hypothetical protein
MPEAAILTASSDLKVPIQRTLLRCVADGTIGAQFFGFTRQRQQIARLLVWERITTRITARALLSAVVSALPCHDFRNLGEVMALMRMAYRREASWRPRWEGPRGESDELFASPPDISNLGVIADKL